MSSYNIKRTSHFSFFTFSNSVFFPLVVFCIPTFSPLILNLIFRFFYSEFPIISYEDFIKRGVVLLLSISLLFNIIENKSYKHFNSFFSFLFISLTCLFILCYAISYPAIENTSFSGIPLNFNNYQYFSYFSFSAGALFYLYNKKTELNEHKVKDIILTESAATSEALESDFDSLRGDK